MNLLIISLLIIFVIILTTLGGYFLLKIEKRNKNKIITTLLDILDSKVFYPTKIIYINKFLSVALNKNETKIAFIRNFNPNNPTYYDYLEIALSFIEKIEKNVSIKLYYLKQAQLKTLNIYPINKEIKDFFHQIYLKSCAKKIENKFPQTKFSYFSSSDWECSYVWAYSKISNEFAYFKTDKKSHIFKVNLKKEHFTIDTKYKYLEAPVFGIAQQLFIYDNEFLDLLYESMLKSIKSTAGKISDNTIYYDNFNNIAYLSNGVSSIQSIILDKINDIFYRENRISFTLLNSNKVINFMANSDFINSFEDFITNYNLKKIAQNFDYQLDKLINTTQHTKFIVDFSRDRVIYCANLNKLSSFSYITISFYDLKDISIQKSGIKFFVRITTKNDEIIDVSCDKKEVAQYIEAIILKIIE